MNYQLFLTRDAIHDLEELYHYILINDSEENANYVLKKIETLINSLTSSPKRGVYPKELVDVGVRDYRELFFKPYRIIYRIIKNKIYIMFIADGRRDMKSLLTRRLMDI